MIGILSAMAIPSFLRETRDRRAYDDAGRILELVRNAKTRARGRGAATLVTFDVSAGNGKYFMYEAVDANAGNVGNARTPHSTCSNTATAADAITLQGANPVAGTTYWNFIDGVDMNSALETQYAITSAVTVTNWDANNALSTTTPKQYALCITPGGRMFGYAGAFNTLSFTAAGAVVGTVRVDITRNGLDFSGVEGIARSVVIPTSGNARLISAAPPAH